MNLGLKGRTALVTGASQGIGRSIAKALAMEGVMVIGAARRTALIEELSAEAQLAGGMPIRAMHVDMMDPGAVSGLARDALDLAPGRLDILVNAAGASRPVPTDAPAQEWEDAMRLGFLAPRALAHDLLPAMQANNWGRIVNITGTSEPRFLSASTPAKAALHVWSKGLSRETARDGVTINCIQPGRIRSEQLKRKLQSPEAENLYAHDIPMGRIGEPEEVAAAVVFLASEAASYVTGIVLPVDGSFRLFAF
jgi:3-oxoacyl-[acyl-carrier protein] reductase